MNRREMIAAGGAAAAAFLAPRAFADSAANTPLKWAPYRNTIAIDGAAGLSRLRVTKVEGQLSDVELQDGRESGLSAVVLTLAPQGAFWFSNGAYELATQRVESWDEQCLLHPDFLLPIRTGADLKRANREKKLGLIYGFQDTSPLGEDLDRVDLFQRRGVRLIQLTHNRRNLVGDGCMEPGNAGLSNYGHAVIERLNERKVVVDCAHGARRTQAEAVVASKRPVLISHTGCAALSDLPRCSTDETLRAMADRGGVAGIIFWPYLRLHGQPMAEDVIAHIEHAIKVCGEDHVGIGTDASVSPVPRDADFEKDNREMIVGMKESGIFPKDQVADLYTFIPDLNHASRFETLAAMLSKRGHSDARIAKVLGENFARVMTEIWG